MRRLTEAWLVAATATLAGCAYIPLAPTVAEIVNSAAQDRGYANPDFTRAAAEACEARAARYGRVSVTSIQQQSSTTARVRGAIQTGYEARTFGCSFRSDGRITDFDLN